MTVEPQSPIRTVQKRWNTMGCFFIRELVSEILDEVGYDQIFVFADITPISDIHI